MPFQRLKAWGEARGLGVAEALSDLVDGHLVGEHLLGQTYRERRDDFLQLPFWSHEFVGAGPFRVRELVGGSRVVLDAFDHYALGRPRIDGIDIIIVPDSNALVTHILSNSSELTLGGRVSIDPHVFAHFRGMNLEAHSRSWLQLMPRQASAALLHVGAYGLIMGIMLLGVLIPLHDVWHGQARPEHTETDVLQHTQRLDVKGAGRHLLQSIARLDDTYEHGLVDADAYQQRRQTYRGHVKQ